MANGMAGCEAMGVVGMVLSGLLGLALLVVLVLGAVWFVRQLWVSRAGSSEPSAPDALEILRREYAGGRLSREDFLQRSDDLTVRSS